MVPEGGVGGEWQQLLLLLGGVSHSQRGGPKSITSNRREQVAFYVAVSVCVCGKEREEDGGDQLPTPCYHHYYVCLHRRLLVCLQERHRLANTDFGWGAGGIGG